MLRRVVRRAHNAAGVSSTWWWPLPVGARACDSGFVAVVSDRGGVTGYIRTSVVVSVPLAYNMD